ncbi:MAG: hypothetical protein ACYDHH_02495 [Solirubrobacteraceae bacterium]
MGNRDQRRRLAPLLGVLVAAIASIWAAAAVAATITTPVLHVTPAVGKPSSTFRVKLTSPIDTGPGATVYATVSLAKRHHGDCQAGAGEATGDVPDHLTQLEFSPGVGKWCVGKYSGYAQETITPICKAGQPCPQYIAVRQLGHFSFVVRATRVR